MAPVVSVIIPTFNRASLLQDAIDSVSAQTFGDWELWVVDDGSTDDTEVVVRSVPDPRIQYVRQDNQGVGAARNLGIDCARGDWIAFLDSDDMWLPNCLEAKLELAHQNQGIECITGGCV